MPGETKVVADFRTDLAYSEDPDDERFWEAIYRQAFQAFLRCMAAPGDTVSQRKGIDRIVMLTNGIVLKMDEKKLRHDYPHMFLEYISNDRTGAPGWIEKELEIDYITYAFMPTRRAHLVPWIPLQRAWQMNKAGWIAMAQEERDGFRMVITENRGYRTHGVAVPWRHIFPAIARAGYVQL